MEARSYRSSKIDDGTRQVNGKKQALSKIAICYQKKQREKAYCGSKINETHMSQKHDFMFLIFLFSEVTFKLNFSLIEAKKRIAGIRWKISPRNLCR